MITNPIAVFGPRTAERLITKLALMTPDQIEAFADKKQAAIRNCMFLAGAGLGALIADESILRPVQSLWDTGRITAGDTIIDTVLVCAMAFGGLKARQKHGEAHTAKAILREFIPNEARRTPVSELSTM